MLEYRMNEAQILRRQGKRIKQIAEIMCKSERTIYTYLSEPARPRKKRSYVSKLDPFKDTIKSILENKQDYNYNRILLFEDLQKLGYEGGISILREYTAELAEKEAVTAYYRFETIPGYQAQVDWKDCGKRMVEGKEMKVYAFTMTLGFSRKPFIVHTLCMDQATVLACHILAFHYFGGIPREILYDNMKTAFIYTPDKGWQVNKYLLQLANHYGFTPRRCKVRRPQTKGKVERTIGYYDGNFLPRIQEEDLTVEELNEKVLAWIDHISVKKIRELKESRKERFEKEKKHLLPLPKTDYNCETSIPVKVYGNSLIHYQTNKYSVPPAYIGKTIALMHHPLTDTAKLYHEEEFIREIKLFEKGAFKEEYRPEDKEQLIKLVNKQKNRKTSLHTEAIAKKAKAKPDIRTPGDYDKFSNPEEVA